MNRHDFVPGDDDKCSAYLARPGETVAKRCSQPQQATVHQDLPPTRTAAERRARRRQDYANRFAQESGR